MSITITEYADPVLALRYGQSRGTKFVIGNRKRTLSANLITKTAQSFLGDCAASC